MIKYHGGVLAIRAIEHWEYAGRNFCVSWAYDERLKLCHDVGQSVMLDNGAFSFFTQGKAVNWEDYYRWAEPWLRYQTTWAIVPDVIGGTEAQNDELVAAWPFGHKGAPVYHITSNLARLERLITDGWPLVCLGISSKPLSWPCTTCKAHVGQPCTVAGEPRKEPCKAREDATKIDSPLWKLRMEQVMDVACDAEGYPRTHLHMLRGLRFCGGPYPLYSADSATVARGWSGAPGGNEKVPARQVAKYYASFDGLNPGLITDGPDDPAPPRWERNRQVGLFELDETVDLDAVGGGPLGEPHPDNDTDAIPLQRTGLGKAQDTLL